VRPEFVDCFQSAVGRVSQEFQSRGRLPSSKPRAVADEVHRNFGRPAQNPRPPSPAGQRGLGRHSCASLLIAQGVPLKVIQEILRHTNIRTTSDRYTHLVPQVVSEALAAMDRTLFEEAREVQSR
jgi:hypothetical protein